MGLLEWIRKKYQLAELQVQAEKCEAMGEFENASETYLAMSLVVTDPRERARYVCNSARLELKQGNYEKAVEFTTIALRDGVLNVDAANAARSIQKVATSRLETIAYSSKRT